jgi:diamine N-acetyltransferase
MVSLRPLTASNRQTVEALRVSPSQERFVSGVAQSLREAAEHSDARALYWAVYAEDTPVGFVMIADEVGSPDYIPHYLWKLLIDERYQRQGFGTATLDLIVEYFRGRPGVEVLTTSAAQGDGSPIKFYECYGFETSCVNPLGEKDVQTTMSSGRASVYARVGGRAEPAWEPGAHPPGAPWRPPHADGAQARKAKSESPPGGPSNRKRKRALPLRSSAPEPPCG